MAYFKARISGSSGNEPVLLWTNPNPTSNFAAQTINIDVSEYKNIGFEYALWPSSTGGTDIYKTILDKKTPYMQLSLMAGYGQNNGVYWRNITIGDGTMTFTNGLSPSGQSQANFLIIRKIYGIKNDII